MKLEIDGRDCGAMAAATHVNPLFPQCATIHGHTWVLHLRAEGEPHDGVLLELHEAKEALRTIARAWDHTFIVPERCRGVTESFMPGHGGLSGHVHATDYPQQFQELRIGRKTYLLPPTERIAWVPVEHASSEALAAYAASFVQEFLARPSLVIWVGLEESPGAVLWARAP